MSGVDINGQLQPAKIVHAFEPYRVRQNMQKSLQTETTNQRTAAEMSPNSEGRTVSPGTASNSNTVTRAFAWESNRITPKAHTLSQPAGPLDGLILRTGFWAQFPAQIWDRVALYLTEKRFRKSVALPDPK